MHPSPGIVVYSLYMALRFKKLLQKQLLNQLYVPEPSIKIFQQQRYAEQQSKVCCSKVSYTGCTLTLLVFAGVV